MNIRRWEEVCEMLPPLSTSERLQLSASIERDGVRVPVLLFPDGRIIDGHHRWELSGGKAPTQIINDLSEDEALTLALTMNLARRQLSPEQLSEAQENLRLRKELRKQLAIKMRDQGMSQEAVATIVGVDQRTVDRWEDDISDRQMPSAKTPDLRVSIPREKYEEIAQRRASGEPIMQLAADYKITPGRISQITTLVEARKQKIDAVGECPFPEKRYSCIVVDPPWPVVKIERENRPNQGASLDYATMSIEEIANLPLPKLCDTTGCHIYLWVTQKYLPDGLWLIEHWGFKYQCLLTWVKPTGITPYSWMYNTEHVIYAHRGNLPLLKNGVKLSFDAPVTGHSVKPDLFYDRVSKVSPEPRLDMFARSRHEGFEPWGAEAPIG